MNAINLKQLDDSQVKFPSPSPPCCSWVRASEQEKTLASAAWEWVLSQLLFSLSVLPLLPTLFCPPVEAAWERLSFQDLSVLASFTFSLMFAQWCKQ